MKLKCTPEDFQVEEQSEFQPSSGRFALYRLTKRSLGTPEVLAAVARRWNIPRGRIASGGLKDRHALTTQLITIERGPERDLKQDKFEMVYLGQAERAFTAQDIAGNKFQIAIRNLTRAKIDAAKDALRNIPNDGLPNYFDDQRFRSLGPCGEFVAEPWCRGDYERAVWLAIAEFNTHDRPELRTQKNFLREHWKDWEACRRELKGTPLDPFVQLLARKADGFREAITLIDQGQRSLYLAAFQSALWNEMLVSFLSEHCRPEQLQPVKFAAASLPYPVNLTAEQRGALAEALLPLPSARLHLEACPTLTLVERTLAARNLSLRELRVKYPRDSFFSRSDRAALIFPEGLAVESAKDELYEERRQLILRFQLPRGAYATVLVKRISLTTNE